MITYSDENIKIVLQHLNNLEIKGIENAKRIVIIEGILQNPKEVKNE